MNITFRNFQSEQDYAGMRRLLMQIYELSGPLVYCTVGDLDWWRSTKDDPRAIEQARLALDEREEVVGIAWPGDNQVDIMVHPAHRELEEGMLAWAEERHFAKHGAEQPVLTARAYEQDAARVALLHRRGYERGTTYYSTKVQALNRPLPEPSLPSGYRIRHVNGEDDLDRRVAVHRDAFAPSRMTVAKHRRVMASPTYRPELDLVVVAPDGDFAAYCLVWLDEHNQIGVFEPVGCHSAYRRQGLTKAVLLEGLRRLQVLGAQTAYVIGLGGAVAATRLYESAGFHEIGRDYGWTKQLGAPAGASIPRLAM